MNKMIGLVVALSVSVSPAIAQKTDTARINTAAVAQPVLPVVKSVVLVGRRNVETRIENKQAGTVGGQEATGTVELSAPAPCVWGCGTYVNGQPAGGMLVSASSSNPTLAKVPTPGILIPVGKTTQTFTIITTGVTAATRVTISVWRDGSPAQSATLMVVPPSLTGLTVDPSSVVSGAVVHGAAAFNGTPGAAGAVSAKLTSSNPAAAQAPQSVGLDVNKTVAPFDIKTLGVASNTTVTISAVQGDATRTATVTVTPATFTDFLRTFPCRCGPLTVTLNGVAPAAGLVVAISSSNPAAASVPASITIPGGANSGVVDVTHHQTYSSQNSTISATLNGATKKWNEFVFALLKPDLVIKTVTLQDRFGNTIAHPADSQPFKICVTVAAYGYGGFGDFQYPGPTKMRVAYLAPTGTGTSVGHEFDVDVHAFTVAPTYVSPDGSYLYIPPICVDLPGMPANSYMDVTSTADSTNKVDESNEGNNTYKFRITRP